MKKFYDLIALADQLLGPKGCPWDKEQNFDSLKQYLQEETLEVVEAIDKKDYLNLKEELGDLLYNIIFITKIAEANNFFKIDEVIEGIYQKLVRRHPHIFGKEKLTTAQEVKDLWQEIKKKEKAGD